MSALASPRACLARRSGPAADSEQLETLKAYVRTIHEGCGSGLGVHPQTVKNIALGQSTCGSTASGWSRRSGRSDG